MDEAAVRRLLRDYDPDLRLVPRGQHYSVYRYTGGDRPAEFVLAWTDNDGNGLPLSSAILDKVKLLDRNTRSKAPDADELEHKRKLQLLKKEQSDAEDVRDDYKSLHGRIPHLTHGKFKGKR